MVRCYCGEMLLSILQFPPCFPPVLFLLYINDMHRSSNQMRFVHFADNTAVFASDSDINNVHATVNKER